MLRPNRVICVRIERQKDGIPVLKNTVTGPRNDADWFLELLGSDNPVSRLWHSAIKHATEEVKKFKEKHEHHHEEHPHDAGEHEHHQEVEIVHHQDHEEEHAHDREPGDSEEALRLRYYEDVHVFREIFEKAAMAWMKFMEEKEILDEAKAEEAQHESSEQEEHEEEKPEDGLPQEEKQLSARGARVVYVIKCDGN